MQETPRPDAPPPETPPQPAEPVQPSQPAQPTVPPVEFPNVPPDVDIPAPGASGPAA